MLKKLFSRGDKPITGTITFDEYLLNLEPKNNWWKRTRQFLGAVAGFVLLTILLLITSGVPYLRWDEPLADTKGGAVLREENLAFTRYISFGGSRRIHANEYGQGLPLIIWISFGDTDNAEEDDSGL